MRALYVLVVLVAAGCVERPSPETPAPRDTPARAFSLTSSAFADGGNIPVAHTCDGDDVQPPLSIQRAPMEATTAALLMYDPDAPIPQAPQRNITHWLAWNIPLVNGSASVAEGEVPGGTVEGANEGGASGYMGPCPPQLSPAHRYVFWLFAVDGTMDLAEGADRAAFEDALDGRAVDTTTLTGMYARRVGPPTDRPSSARTPS